MVKELVVEADIPGVFSGIGEINFLDPGPVDGGETHGTGFATGVDFASYKVEGVELECRLSDSPDLRMGCGVLAGDYLIIPFRNNSSILDDDRTEWASSSRPHMNPGELYGPAHEFLLHPNIPFFKRWARMPTSRLFQTPRHRHWYLTLSSLISIRLFCDWDRRTNRRG